MAFPQINFKLNGIEHADELSTLVARKFESLGKFIKVGVPALCEVEFEKVAEHKKGKLYRVEANLTINGTLYRAEATEETFERSIDEARDELDKEIRRSKDKRDSLIKRAGRNIKEKFFRN
jgi:ribosomal subunit interface protein